jgi:hypothetical protein
MKPGDENAKKKLLNIWFKKQLLRKYFRCNRKNVA